MTTLIANLLPIPTSIRKADLRHTFTRSEWMHINAIKNASRRMERMFGRLWMKTKIGKVLGLHKLNDIELDAKLKCASVPLKLSLSHSGGWLLSVLSPDKSNEIEGVGCDVEQNHNLSKSIKWIAHPDDHVEKHKQKYVWGIKEACFKALPHNTSIQLHQISIDTKRGTGYFKHWLFHFHCFCVADLTCSIAVCLKQT